MTIKEFNNLDIFDHIVHDRYGICGITCKMVGFASIYSINPVTYEGRALLAQDKGVQFNGSFVSVPIKQMNLNEMRIATAKETKDISEHANIQPIFDLQAIYLFCQKNKVEVVLQDDLQYYCLINYKDGDRAYAIEINPIEAFTKGIINYVKEKTKL